MVTFTVGISESNWPNGKPVRTKLLAGGVCVHTMADGREITVSTASHRLDYLSTWIGAKPGDTYAVNVAVAGLSATPGFFEAWNFDIDELRSYAFDKTVALVDLKTGEAFAGEELRMQLGGVLRPSFG